MDNKIVLVSGYFDPLHVGHIEYFKLSKKLGHELMVIVNNDEQAALKKGKSFMPFEERLKIIEELKCVDYVVPSIDTSRSVVETIAQLEPKPHYFCNGGDQFNDIIPEADICEKRGIQLVDGLGGKVQSSSWLIKNSSNVQKK